jgi:hypothetical protein
MTKDELVSRIEGAFNDIGIYPMGGAEPKTEELIKSDAYKHGVNSGVMEVMNVVNKIIYDTEGDIHPEEKIMIADDEWSFMRMGDSWFIFLSDTWYYASADWELITPDEYGDVISWYRRFGHAGVLYWVWKNKRDHMPMIPQYRKQVEMVRDYVENV